jgi:1-deoxy-D-xylulose-5-phosphate reductoisomerase
VGGSALNPLVILGATGSIGRQALEVAERIGAPVRAIGARRASLELLEIARSLPDAQVCVVERGEERSRLRSELGDRLHFGQGAVTEAAASHGVTVVNGIVGVAGLTPSLAALYAGNRLALANKESLVTGGELIVAAVAENGGEVVPIDSEHAAIWQCIIGEPQRSVERIILTASGGPFRGATSGELASVTIDDALAHPTWSMGPRITIDSATMMNKAFEVIEAHHLFALPFDAIDVVIHPQSMVHSFVQFSDGVVKAEIGDPDMRKPIQYAITAPDRIAAPHEPFSPIGLGFEFEEPDRSVFPCLDLGYEAGRAGGTAPAVLNAVDEVAVAAFLDGRLPFTAIAEVVEEVLGRHDVTPLSTVDDVMDADEWARSAARSVIDALG